MTIHSLFYFAAEGGECLLLQACCVPFAGSSGTGEKECRVY
jgi:hypothetical protein